VRQAQGPRDLGQPQPGAARAEPEEAHRGGQEPAGGSEAAGPLRVLALHADIVVCVSGIWQTTCTIVHCGDETFVVDSPVLPEELEALPSVLAQPGWELTGLVATHGDWDHLLARLAWPDAPLGVAESTAQRLGREPGAAQRKLRDFDREHYVERPRPLTLGDLQPLPVPGTLEIGDRELVLHPAEGHTPDGMALVAPWAGVLVCGDYLSPVEDPMVEGDRDAYRATLERLRGLAAGVEWVVPGHGTPLPSARALEILEDHLGKL
jgi:glyoxylase-like metal-dependent hydrolase (beta-lactamase superfamily II)